MITRNTTGPYFGGVREHSSFKLLGNQGQKSLEIIKPLLDNMGSDCDFVLGATPNKLLGNKPTLTVVCQDLNTSRRGLLAKLANYLSMVTYTVAQSSTEAVSPHSLYTAAASAKLNFPKQLIGDFTAEADTFFAKPKIKEAVTTYEKSYSKIPTAVDIRQDERRSISTARTNGHFDRYPLPV